MRLVSSISMASIMNFESDRYLLSRAIAKCSVPPAEFPSVEDAVRGAVETQQAVAEYNTDLPEEERIEFRIGIDLGEFISDGDDIQGDGVDVTAQSRHNACLTLFP